MASLNNIVDSIADGLGKSFDHMFKERLKFTVKYWRAFLIRRDLERNIIDKNLIQSICLDIEDADLSACCSVATGCMGSKTILKVPKGITVKSHTPFLAVLTPKRTPISYYNFNSLMYIQHKKYTNKLPYYDYINGHIVLYNVGPLKNIVVSGIFENPEELPDCNSTTDPIDCYQEENFPISTHMITTIMDGIISNELRLINPDDQQIKLANKENDRN